MLTRRGLLLSFLAWHVSGRPSGNTTKPPLVLIHGAFHGAWCWQRVVSNLKRAGRDVHTPTLSGLGERAAEASQQTNLSTHVRDVAHYLASHKLRDCIVVGHSYAGFVLAGLVAAAPARIRRLVFLDAFLPKDGECVMDYLPPDLPERIRAGGHGWRLPMRLVLTVEELGVTEKADVAWVTERLSEQPLATFQERVRVPPDAWRRPCTYIWTSEGPPFDAAAARARSLGFEMHTLLSAGHDSMVTRPAELAAILNSLH
jgi:pimeloyl-ACP methyl ester carboxylesterase